MRRAVVFLRSLFGNEPDVLRPGLVFRLFLIGPLPAAPLLMLFAASDGAGAVDIVGIGFLGSLMSAWTHSNLRVRAHVDEAGVTYVNRFRSGTIAPSQIVDARYKGWLFRQVVIDTLDDRVLIDASIRLPWSTPWFIGDHRSVERFVESVRSVAVANAPLRVKRPTGVAIIAAGVMFGAAMSILIGAVFLAASLTVECSLVETGELGEVGPVAWPLVNSCPFSITLILSAVAVLAGGVGLWRGTSWGRSGVLWAVAIFAGLGIGWIVVNTAVFADLIEGDPQAPSLSALIVPAIVVSVALLGAAGWVFWYLRSPKVERWLVGTRT